MRKLKRNIAAAMIMTMSLSMLPVQFQTTVASAAQTKKVTVKKAEITVNSNKAIKSALKNKSIKRIVLNATSIKSLNIPKGNYKNKTLVINAADKSKVYIAKGAKFKKIIYLGDVKNASLVLDESGNKIEILSKTNLNISGKAAYAELTYKTGSEGAKVTSKIELIVINKTKKSVKAVIAGNKITVKPGETYSNENLDIEDDETAQGAANLNVNDDNTSNGSSATGNTVDNATGGNTGGGFAGGGSSGGGFSGGGLSGGGNAPNNGGNAGNKVETTKLVNEARTKIIDATSFLRYVVVNFEKDYTKDNTTVYVDDVDITSELTPVDKEGTLYKWEVSSLNPGELTVVSKKDNSVKQTVKLSNTKPENIVKPELKGKNKAPKYIIGYATIPVWDYHLDNYDDNGEKRVSPKSTTFSTNFKATKKIGERVYYTEPAELGSEVEIQFNYTDEADKKWFDSIPETGALELVQDDEAQRTIDVPGGLVYTKRTKEHHKSTVAVLAIKTGEQINFRNAGYYRLRIRPAGSQSVMVRFKVEEKVQPKFLIEEPSLQSGKNLHFIVENVSSRPGKSPVEKAELVLPTGETRTLRYISDYFLIGNTFVLYNDVTKGNEKEGTQGINNTLYNGKYTLKVYFREYKMATCIFSVTEGKDVEPGKENKTTVDTNKVMTMGSRSGLLSIDGMMFDAVAGASRVNRAKNGNSNSGGGSGAPVMSADLMFNVDLLANAEIFDKLKLGNDYATEIVDRFEKDIIRRTSVYDETSGKFYNWLHYNTAVVSARAEGKYLTFADFIKTSDAEEVKRTRRPKEVLEDNLLGALTYGNTFGKAVPELTYKREVMEGEDLVVTGDADYISKITKLSPNRDKNLPYSYTMEPKNYKAEGNTLTIKADGIVNKYNPRYGELEIFVVAEGYQPQVIKINVTKKTEEKPGQPQKPDEPKQPEDPKKPDTPKNPDNGGQNDTKPDETNKHSIPLLKSGENYTVQDTSNKNFTLGSGFTGSISTDVKNWLGMVNSVTFDSKDVTFKLNAWGYLEITRPDEKNKEITMVIKATGYKTYSFTIVDNGNNVVITNGRETQPAVPSKPETGSQPENPNSGKEEQGTKPPVGDDKKDEIPDESGMKTIKLPEKGKKYRVDSESNVISFGYVFAGTADITAAIEWIKNIYAVNIGGKDLAKGEFTINTFSTRFSANRPARDNNKELKMIIKSKGYKTYTFTIDNTGWSPEIVYGEETYSTVAPSESDKVKEEEKKAKEEQEKKEQEEKKKQEAEAAKKAEEAKKQAAVTRASEAAGRANTEAERADDEAKKAEEVASKSESAKDIAVKARTAANLAKEAAAKAKVALAEAENANNSADAEAAANKAEADAEVAESKAKEAETARKEAETKKAEEDAKKNSLKSLNLPEGKFKATSNTSTIVIKNDFLGTSQIAIVQEWLNKVESITFDGVTYKQGGNKLNANEYSKKNSELKIMRPKNKGKGISLIIRSEGFKSYELTIDNSQSLYVKIISVKEI